AYLEGAHARARARAGTRTTRAFSRVHTTQPAHFRGGTHTTGVQPNVFRGATRTAHVFRGGTRTAHVFEGAHARAAHFKRTRAARAHCEPARSQRAGGQRVGRRRALRPHVLERGIGELLLADGVPDLGRDAAHLVGDARGVERGADHARGDQQHELDL